MKNLKRYYGIICITFVLSTLLACSKDNSIEETNITPTVNNSNVSGATICDITGLSITTPDFSFVDAGTTTSYKYITNKGIPNTVVWKIESANPAGSITLSGSGTTITATFRNDFIDGKITALGEGNVLACSSLLKISKK